MCKFSPQSHRANVVFLSLRGFFPLALLPAKKPWQSHLLNYKGRLPQLASKEKSKKSKLRNDKLHHPPLPLPTREGKKTIGVNYV
jgi:hypothetical protein